MNSEKSVIIGGGVGPMAGVFFHKKLIEKTLSTNDQGHLNVIHISRSYDIAERMAFLAGEATVSPADGMFRSIKIAAKGLPDLGKNSILAVPCNTFHAPIIFDRFEKLLLDNGIHLKVINIIDETVSLVCNQVAKPQKIGVLGTVGTRESRIFHNGFIPQDIEVIDIPLVMQKDVSDLILRIKATNEITPSIIENLKSFIATLSGKGAEAIILGCTELSMIVDKPIPTIIPYIDPMTILAEKVVECATA